MNIEDLHADTQMYLQQIIELNDLLIETNTVSITNIITLRDLAEHALKNFHSV